MMEYSQLSDRDIDALVLQVIYGNQAKDKDIMRAWLRGGFKYTTNPADAWPIIDRNRIGVMPSEMKAKELWISTSGKGSYSYHENPLRAAMIVFLMMQEKKNG
jgi:hypothetical protein